MALSFFLLSDSMVAVVAHVLGVVLLICVRTVTDLFVFSARVIRVLEQRGGWRNFRNLSKSLLKRTFAFELSRLWLINIVALI